MAMQTFGVLILLVSGIFLRTAKADDGAPQQSAKMTKMEGGTVIDDDMKFFPETVKIMKKNNATDAKGETKCMGVIFSSPVVFTSMLCELTDANKDLWTIEPIKKSDSAAIGRVHDGRHKADFKKIDLAVPGLVLTDENSGDMPMAAPFNQNPDDDMAPAAVVLAFGDQVKACTIKILIDDKDECAKLYQEIATKHPASALPPKLYPHLYCAVKGTEKINVTMMNSDKVLEVDVGMPCDDSLGAPVYSHSMVFGIVIGAFCGATKVALIQPSVQGLSLEGYTETRVETDSTDINGTAPAHDHSGGPSDSTHNGKLQTDKPIPARLRNPTVQDGSSTIFSHLQVCSFLIFGALAVF